MSSIRALRQLPRLSCSLRTSCSVNAIAASPRFAFAQSTRVAARAFSVSARVYGEGATDVALSTKLAEELKYERTEAPTTPEPEYVAEFKRQGVWSIEDALESDEVAFTRKFGNETIRLMFSIADLQSPEEDEYENENENEEGREENEEAPVATYPIRVSLSITKSSTPGSINIDTMCQEGAFVVDNIAFYKDAKLGTELTAESDWTRRGMYIGPQFDTLDVGVQEEFEKFLQERGVNESLALFIPDYCEYKEQKEYVRWLESVKNFVEA